LTYDPTFEVNFKKHLQKLKEERIKRSKEERAKHQEEFKKLQAHLKTLYM
jgi:hypothetical protein